MLGLSEPPIVALLAALVLTVVVVFLAAAWITTRATRRPTPKLVLPQTPPQVMLFLLDEDEKSVLHRVKIDVRARKPTFQFQGQMYVASRACTGGYCYRKHA